MHAIFFTPKGLAVQVAIPKGTSMNTRFYRKKVLRKLSNSTRNVDRRQASVVFICYMTRHKCVVFLVRTGDLCSRQLTQSP